VTINSVISKINYREIPKLVQFAKDLDIKITLSAFCDWGTKFGKNYKELAVWEEGNKEQKEFIDVLRNKTIAYENCTMTPVFKNLI
jgi:molybdenum cofactor biosynthesis enzyme MoaA